MKKHAIIPIFISHRGCPNDCVFCNQRKITSRQGDVTPEEVRNTIETWLSTLEPAGIETVEIAFYGGSFTGIPLSEQQAFLSIAHAYKKAGRIDKIHLSTRPDYIDESILTHLKGFGVDVIELGVQSFDDKVLRLTGRGHDSSIVYYSSRLIQEYGFTLGIQLMVGLPGSTLETDIFSAKETVSIGPELARLYPTVVIGETTLYDWCLSGQYEPLTEKEAVLRTKAMYRILTDAGINIIRVGLKASDIINPHGQIAANTFHPAFRQLVEGEIARDMIEPQLKEILSDNHPSQVWFVSNEKCRNTLFGHKSCNRQYFAAKYPNLIINYVTDKQVSLALDDHQYLVLSKFK